MFSCHAYLCPRPGIGRYPERDIRDIALRVAQCNTRQQCGELMNAHSMITVTPVNYYSRLRQSNITIDEVRLSVIFEGAMVETAILPCDGST